MPKAAIVVLVGSLSLLAGHLNGQSQDDDGTKGRRIIFHVTSVHRADDDSLCQSGECSATKFTVEGYANGTHPGFRIEYVLTCDEYMVHKPNPHITISCGRVHANNDYEATVFTDSIAFIDSKPKAEGSPAEVDYDIKSEKEVSKQGK